MPFVETFGGELIFPSQTSYLAITTSVDVTLQWPIEQQIAGIDVVADFMDITASIGGLNIDMPDARQASTGQKVLFNNPGANTYTVRDDTGGTIQTVAIGEQWVFVLTDNTTQAGTWLTFQMGATVSSATAGSLTGAGIKAISTTLNQMIESNVEAATPFTVVDADRATCLIYTTGTGTANLPSPAAVGDDWFFMLRNSGSGTLNIVPPSGVIDGAASINLDPNDSCFIFTDGTDFFTVGLSTGSVIAFDFVSIAIPGSGDFTLSGANLNRIAYRFTGLLTGNRKIVVPGTTQQYWVDNATTGAFALTIGTSAQVGEPEITQGLSEILYCDGVDVVSAVSATALSVPVTIAQGGTGATTVGSAQTALQVPPTSRDMIAGVGLTGGGDLSADRTFDVVQALEATLGGAEIATQAETDLGVDDATIITPLKLANAASQIVVANKSANTNRNNTTVKTADPDLQLALSTGTWLITGLIVWSEIVGASQGIRFDFSMGVSGTAGAGSYIARGTVDSATPSIQPNIGSGNIPTATNTSMTAGDTAIRKLMIQCYVTVTVAGSLDFNWAQDVSNANNTVVYGLDFGSGLVAIKIA